MYAPRVVSTPRVGRGAGARGYDPTTPRDYARAADELAIVLETCFRASDKATAAAMQSALLAARLSSGVDTAAQADAMNACGAPRAPFSPPRGARRSRRRSSARASSARVARGASSPGARARRRPDRGIVVDLPRDALDLAARARAARPRASGVRVRRLRDAVARGKMLATPRRGRLRPSRCRRLAEQSEARVGRGCMSRRVVAGHPRRRRNARAARDATRVTASDGPASARALCRSRVFDVLRIAVVSTRPARGAPGTSRGRRRRARGATRPRLVRHVVESSDSESDEEGADGGSGDIGCGTCRPRRGFRA